MKKFIQPFLLLIFFIIYLQLSASPPQSPYNLRSFDKYNPIGTDDNPYFGWYINDPDDNEIQTGYQILVASSRSHLNADKGDIWDSGKVASRKQNYIYSKGEVLSSATSYYWKVRTWDKDGNVSSYSNTATFETGLISNSDWAGTNWIRRDTDVADDYTYFRKKTSLPDKTITRAIAYISACHSYELYINGSFVGKGYNNNYPQYSYYNAWDISDILSSNSENTIAL